MVRNRKSYLDVLKGIGAILVVLGHLVCYDGKIKIYIYSFHMPLFFFISGYLFKFNSNLSEFIRKKFKRLMVPYFIYTIISMIVVFSIDGITISKREIFYNFFFIKGSNYWNSSLWFLVVMFFVLILFNFLIYFKKRYSINLNKQYLFFFILLLLVSIILVTFNVKLIFGLEIVPHALLIFYIGYLFRKYDKYVKKVCLKLNINKKVKFILIIFFFIFSYILAIYNGRVNMSTCCFNNYSIYLCVAIINIAIYLYISIKIGHNFILERFGRLSMTMFCTQRIIFKLLSIIQNRIGYNFLYSSNILVNLFTTAFILSIYLFYDYLRRRKAYECQEIVY